MELTYLKDFIKLKKERKILEKTLEKLKRENAPRDIKAIDYRDVNSFIKGSHQQQEAEQLYKKIIDVQNKIEEKIIEIKNQEVLFLNKILKMKNTEIRSFLFLKYIHEQTPKEICKFLEIGRTKYYEIENEIKKQLVN